MQLKGSFGQTFEDCGDCGRLGTWLGYKPRTRAPIWHPDVCKIARHRSERLRMSILRKEGKGGGITRGN